MTDQSGAPTPGADGKTTSNVVPLPKREAWKAKLYRTATKAAKIKNVIANGVVALRECPEWKGAVKFDENAQGPHLGRRPPEPWPQTGDFVPRPWNDHDDGLLSEWLTRQGIDLSPAGASEATLIVARESSFHPIRDYLNSLVWDGKPRTATWLFDYLGAESKGGMGEYHSAIGQRWLISGVARIFSPGCQVDHVLIFEGLQGNGKSSFLRELCGNDSWFSDEGIDLNDHQDAAMALEGKWIHELAELETFKGVGHERLKAFITRRKDHIRKPWGRRFIDLPRQVIFAGSTNRNDYFNDETGNRRYWPFKATKLEIAGVGAARDQLWAESVKLYRDKFPHWLDTPRLKMLAAEAQDQRFDSDPWEEKIEELIEGQDEVVPKVVLNVLLPDREVTKADFMRLGKILRHLKFERVREYDTNGKRVRVFRRLR